MRLQSYLKEAYYSGFIKRSHMIDIFVNPTLKELRELYASSDEYGSIGFICDMKEQNIYFFSRENIIHQEAFDHIKSGTKLYKNPNYLAGEFKTKNNKPIGLNFNMFDKMTDDTKAYKMDWSYFNKWIPNLNDEYKKFIRRSYIKGTYV